MKKNEKTKMKFFAHRDWYILHFVLTVIIGIISVINLVFVWFFIIIILKISTTKTILSLISTERLNL